METPKTGAYDLEGVMNRRELPEYEDNPSIPIASQNAKIGTRRIPNRAGDKAMIVSESGEVLAPAGFHEVVEVDQTQFVKLFVGGVKMINDLSAAGSKVFELVYKIILKAPNTDRVYLHHKITKMAKTTYERGLTELISKEILYKSVLPNLYYININYIFNGNRLAFIKEYRLKASVSGPEDVQEPLPL
jgi:hypothetical protein